LSIEFTRSLFTRSAPATPTHQGGRSRAPRTAFDLDPENASTYAEAEDTSAPTSLPRRRKGLEHSMDSGLVVQKFGGSSLSSAERITRAATRVIGKKNQGLDVIVVVSAMGRVTDELLDLALEITPRPPSRELDMLLTAGERMSMALLAMALSHRGCEAISFTGSQSGIITTEDHTRAKILEVKPTRISRQLEMGKVVIVAGFQGVSRTKEVTTLGRGGSDTTAVALASAFGASYCELLSDVDGVYTADPALVKDARRIDRLSYRELAEMSFLGSRITHHRAVALAENYSVPLILKSSFEERPGTRVEGGDGMEKPLVRSISHRSNVTLARFTAGSKKVFLEFCEAASEAPWETALSKVEASPEGEEVVVELCIESAGTTGGIDVGSFLDGFPGLRDVSVRTGLSLLSVTGHSLQDTPPIWKKIWEAFEEEQVRIEQSFMSPTSLSFVVPEEKLCAVANRLHATLFQPAGTPG